MGHVPAREQPPESYSAVNNGADNRLILLLNQPFPAPRLSVFDNFDNGHRQAGPLRHCARQNTFGPRVQSHSTRFCNLVS